MRHVLGQIVVGACFGDFNRARPFAAAKVGRASGIAEFSAIDDDCVVMKAGRHGLCRKSPIPVGLLLHVGFFAAPEIDPHLRRIGRLEANLDTRVAIDLRVLGVENVGGSWLEITRALSKAKTRT